MVELLSRETFRENVFRRDNYRCVVPKCSETVEKGYVGTKFSAHHVIERRLWTNPLEKEGYIKSNGTSLCETHHQFGAETCVLQPQVLRKWAGIKTVVLPSGWDKTKSYDKWGTQLKRPTRRSIKWPSTPYSHLSPGYDVNDINLPDLKPFLNIPLVLTLKMDGSNAKVGRDIVAARNGSHAEHPSFDRLKAEHAKFRELIPNNILIFGENLTSVHSIHYKDKLALDNFFQVFGVYDMDTMLFGGWNEVEEMAKRIGYPTVPIVEYIEPIAEEWKLEQKITNHFERVVKQGHEGMVLRQNWPFHFSNFEGYTSKGPEKSGGIRVNAICKMVRANHVQTNADHWSKGKIVRNEILTKAR